MQYFPRCGLVKLDQIYAAQMYIDLLCYISMLILAMELDKNYADVQWDSRFSVFPDHKMDVQVG